MMFTDILWSIATSWLVLGAIGSIFSAALVVGYFPLIKWFPVIGQYVPVARLVVLLSAALLCFLVGFRVSDDRAEAKSLRAELASKQRDIDAATSAREDETKRADEIDAAFKERTKDDATYIAHLEGRPVCTFDDSDFSGLPNNRKPAARAKPPARAK